MDKIKGELTAITEKYKKDFEIEINGDVVFKTILDVTAIIDKYKPKLEKELFDTTSSQLKFIDSNDKLVLTEFTRSLLLEFQKFALGLLFPYQ
jgi:hypothetical protein